MDFLALIAQWVLWAYITTECFICFYYIDKLGKGIRFFKYGTAALVPFTGLVTWYLHHDELVLNIWLLPDAAIAQFLMSKTINRLKGFPQQTTT